MISSVQRSPDTRPALTEISRFLKDSIIDGDEIAEKPTVEDQAWNSFLTSSECSIGSMGGEGSSRTAEDLSIRSNSDISSANSEAMWIERILTLERKVQLLEQQMLEL